jgi:hypothetical protein
VVTEAGATFTLNLRTILELDGTANFWPGASAIPDLSFLEQSGLASSLRFDNLIFSGLAPDNNCGGDPLNFLGYVTLVGEDDADPSIELNITKEEVAEELPLMPATGLIGLGLLLAGMVMFFLLRSPGLR